MAIRRIEVLGVDTALEGMGVTRAAALFWRLDAATPWETLADPIRGLPSYNAPEDGHPAWRPVLMPGYRRVRCTGEEHATSWTSR